MSHESTEAPPGRSPPDLHVWSCVTCRRRKVKCDRREPCNICTKNGIECHYPITGRLPNRSRAPSHWPSTHHKQVDLLERLRRLEAVVTELSAQVDEINVTPTIGSSSEGAADTSGTSEQPDEGFGRLVAGADGRVRIEKSFWTVFCDEVDSIFKTIQDASYSSEQAEGKEMQTSACHCQAFVLGRDSTATLKEDPSLTRTQLLLIGRTYSERVHPFVNVLPDELLNAVSVDFNGCEPIPIATKSALTSVIRFAAVVALSSKEVTVAFGSGKQTLVAKLQSSAEISLARAQFLSTKEMNVLQALIIYASMLPYVSASDIVAPIAAVTLQVTLANGLHKPEERNKHSDPKNLLHTWQQVCFLTSRCQVPASAGPEPRLPHENIQVSSSIDGFIAEEASANDIFCETRHSIWLLARHLKALQPANLEGYASVLKNAKAEIYKQLSEPRRQLVLTAFEAFVRRMADLFFAKIDHAILVERVRQLLHREQNSMHGPEEMIHDKLTESSIGLIEIMHNLTTEPHWAAWRWQLHGYFPWPAMRLVFSQLSKEQWTSLSERAWVLARGVVNSLPEEIHRHPVWPSLCKLIAIAEEHRDSEMSRLTSRALQNGDYLELIDASNELFYSSGLEAAAPAIVTNDMLNPNPQEQLVQQVRKPVASDAQTGQFSQPACADVLESGISWTWSKQLFQHPLDDIDYDVDATIL